jgi:small subunit ribosomal protein S8
MSTVSTDPIADMLSRVRNAVAVQKHMVELPYSKVKATVAELLHENKFIQGVTTDGDGINKKLVLKLSDEQSNARITEITRLSKPGRRYYVGATEIPVVKRGRGIVIISTSKGMMTGDQARTAKVGGELICRIY